MAFLIKDLKKGAEAPYTQEDFVPYGQDMLTKFEEVLGRYSGFKKLTSKMKDNTYSNENNEMIHFFPERIQVDARLIGSSFVDEIVKATETKYYHSDLATLCLIADAPKVIAEERKEYDY
jgi:hypothetical protein